MYAKNYINFFRRYKNAASQFYHDYMNYKILVLLKITRILKNFLKSIIDFFFFSQHIMMESSWFENIIKDVRNLFRLEKETNDTTFRGISNLFLLEKENKVIKERILGDIRNTFEHDESYYKPVREGNFWRTDRNKALSVEEYLNEIKPYLKNIIIDLTKSDRWRIQLTLTFNFISSKDDNDEERVMHSKRDNIEIMISDEGDEVIKKLFDSLKNRYQNDLQSMRGSEFVFTYVQVLYYKCYKINFNCGGSYIDSPYWIKNKKTIINPIDQKDKCFQYSVTVALNYEEIKKDPQRITKIKAFTNKYNWKGINYPSEKD